MTEQDSEQTPEKAGWRFPRWWAILLLLLFGFALFGERGVLRLYRSYQLRNSLQRQVEELKAENAGLQAQIKALREDPVTIERVARERLGMVRPGEVVYQFPSSQTPSAAVDSGGAAR